MANPFSGDRILLKDLGFYGFHGLLPQEATLGQRFYIDLEIGADLSRPATTDALEGSISYADIYDTVKDTFEGLRVDLIEFLGQRIVDAIFERFQTVDWIIIRIRKPEAPIAMVRGEAAIELHRQRKEQ